MDLDLSRIDPATTRLSGGWPTASNAARLHEALLVLGWRHDTEESDLVLRYERLFPEQRLGAVLMLADAVAREPLAGEEAVIEDLSFWRLDGRGEPDFDGEPLPFGEVAEEVRRRVGVELGRAISEG